MEYLLYFNIIVTAICVLLFALGLYDADKNRYGIGAIAVFIMILCSKYVVLVLLSLWAVYFIFR